MQLRPNHVLATGLHKAWVQHRSYRRAAKVLVCARQDAVLPASRVGAIITSTLGQLARRYQLLDAIGERLCTTHLRRLQRHCTHLPHWHVCGGGAGEYICYMSGMRFGTVAWLQVMATAALQGTSTK